MLDYNTADTQFINMYMTIIDQHVCQIIWTTYNYTHYSLQSTQITYFRRSILIQTKQCQKHMNDLVFV